MIPSLPHRGAPLHPAGFVRRRPSRTPATGPAASCKASPIRSAGSTTCSPWWRSASMRRCSAGARCGWCPRRSSARWRSAARSGVAGYRAAVHRDRHRGVGDRARTGGRAAHRPAGTRRDGAGRASSRSSTAMLTAPRCRRPSRAMNTRRASCLRPLCCMVPELRSVSSVRRANGVSHRPPEPQWRSRASCCSDPRSRSARHFPCGSMVGQAVHRV